MSSVQGFHSHLSLNEMDALDLLQGFSQRVGFNPKYRMYSGLEEKLKNPEVRKGLLKFFKKHFATGGHVGSSFLPEHVVDKAARAGRLCDNAVGILGPRTKALFDTIAGDQGSVNPYTGWSEYGLFDSIFSGIKDLGSGLINKVVAPIGGALLHTGSQMLPGLMQQAGQMGGQALGEYTGNPELGGMFGQMGQQMGGQLGQNLGGVVNEWGQEVDPNAAQNPYGQAASGAMQNFGQNMQGGMNPWQAMQGAGQNFMQNMPGSEGPPNPYMQALQGMGSSFMNGGGMGNAVNQGMQQMMPQMMNEGMGAYNNYMRNMFPMQQAEMGGGMPGYRAFGQGLMPGYNPGAIPG
jgi:hypothetical protein